MAAAKKKVVKTKPKTHTQRAKAAVKKKIKGKSDKEIANNRQGPGELKDGKKYGFQGLANQRKNHNSKAGRSEATKVRVAAKKRLDAKRKAAKKKATKKKGK